MPQSTSKAFGLPFAATLLLVTGLMGCDGCESEVEDAGGGPAVDAGTIVGPDGGLLLDGGDEPADAGAEPDVPDSGTVDEDAGAPLVDAGQEPPFDWQDLFGDGGVPEELECLPGALPGFSLSEILAAFEFERYQGGSETGVVCGDVTCAEDVPCCELCGYAQCAEPDADGGPAECPAFVRSIACDGHEDCPNDPAADTCCYTLDGTECRAEADCQFELPDFNLGDGGFSFPSPSSDGGGGNGAGLLDAGADGGRDAGDVATDGGAQNLDAGRFDAGAADAGSFDAGALDAGALDAGTLDAGTLDAGAVVEDAGPDEPGPIEAFFDQGVPVCRNTLFDCDPLSLEVCCTSPRIVTLDIGMCLPALLCFNDVLP